jgi:site-specific DNA-adenine methylase
MIELGRYNGGKGNVFRQIINEMPPHKTYVEAFVGGGSVALNKLPAQRNILIDKDPEVIETWLSHLATNDAAAATSQMTMRYPLVTNGDNLDDLANFNDAAPSSNLTMPAVTAIPSDSTRATIVKNDDASGHIVTFDDDTRYELYCADALQLLPHLGLGHDALVYADPPYLLSTRTEKRPLYRYEMGEEWEHEMMIGAFDKLPCKIMISGYWSGLYAGLMKDGWRNFDYTAYDRQNRPRQEYVWCNFPEPSRLHDYTFIGDNFRERERIKRKAARWVGRFENLPALERRAILEQLDAAGVLD